MGKLTNTEIEKYFTVHLPYRTRILLAHFRMTRVPWHGDRAQLEAAFEASLITGRMYLNVLGVSKDKRDQLVPSVFRPDDVSAVDLGGRVIAIDTLPPNDFLLFVGFLRMVDKGSAHLTMPTQHPIESTHASIARICEFVKSHLYDASGRAFET